MATMTFNCTQCNQVLMIDDSAAGTQVQCPSCGTALRVPSAQPAAAPGVARADSAVSAAAAVETAPRYRTVLTVFFVLAALIFFLPFVRAGTSAGPESPFDVFLHVINFKGPEGNDVRTLKEVLFNGQVLAKFRTSDGKEATSMKAMLGVVLLWMTSLGFVGFCVLGGICAFVFFANDKIPGLLLTIALICAVQFVPMTIIADSLIKSAALDGAAAALTPVEAIARGRNHLGVSPAWGAWLLAISSVIVLCWEPISNCCLKKKA